MPTDLEIARWRLRSQRLVLPHRVGARDVVTGLLAVQAENLSQSAWAVAARTGSPDEADLAGLLASGEVIRTHVLRPTWHYVTAADARWLIEVTAPRVRRTLTAAVADREREADALLATLADGPALDRPTLARRLEEAGHALSGHDLMLLLADLELRCLVCSGPPADGTHTYALFGDRVPDVRQPDRDEALAELARRYVAGHGPATERDLGYWATITLGDARRGFAAAEELASFEHDSRTYWHPGDEEPPAGEAEPRGHLLQILDETYRGFQDSRWVLDAAGVVPRQREVAIGMALVGGQMVASMKRTTTTSHVTFTLRPHPSWRPAMQPVVEEAAERYADFLGLDPVVILP